MAHAAASRRADGPAGHRRHRDCSCSSSCWNDYYGPYLYTSENDNWTLSFALASFRGLHNVEWNLVMAATVITMLPIVVLFFFAQKAFVQGVTLTGVKG